MQPKTATDCCILRHKQPETHLSQVEALSQFNNLKIDKNQCLCTKEKEFLNNQKKEFQMKKFMISMAGVALFGFSGCKTKSGYPSRYSFRTRKRSVGIIINTNLRYEARMDKF